VSGLWRSSRGAPTRATCAGRPSRTARTSACAAFQKITTGDVWVVDDAFPRALQDLPALFLRGGIFAAADARVRRELLEGSRELVHGALGYCAPNTAGSSRLPEIRASKVE
jgi:hypothetical protein